MSPKSSAFVFVSLLLGASLVLNAQYSSAQTWTTVADGSRTIVTNPASDIGALLVVAPGKILAGTNAGLWRSTDGGGSWSKTVLGSWSAWCSSLYMHTDGRIFAGADPGLFVSSDSGATWTAVASHPSYDVCRIAKDSHGWLFTATYGYNGVCRSTDNGITWTSLLDSCAVEALIIGPNDILYAGCNGYGNQWAGLRKSTDAGNTWQLISPTIGIRSIVIAADGSTIFGGYEGPQLHTYRSTDGGATWAQSAAFYAEYFATDGNNAIYAASNVGMQKSTDNGASWQAINTGLFNVNGAVPWVRTLTKVGATEFIAGEINTGEIFRSTDLGAHWQTYAALGDRAHVAANSTTIAEPSPGQFFIGSSKFGMSRYTTSGGFVTINNGLTTLQVQALASRSGSLFAGTSGGVFRSTDNGDTWTKFGTSSNNIKALTVLPSGQLLAGLPNAVLKFAADGSSYAVMSTGLVSKSVNAFWTGSDGRTFVGTESDLYRLDSVTWIPQNVSSGTAKVTGIDASGQTIAVATRDSGAYFSTDNGQHWIHNASGIEGYALKGILLTESSRAYVCTDLNGVYKDTVFSTLWKAANQGVNDLKTRALLAGSDHCLYAITDSGFILRTSSPVTSVERVVSPVPEVFRLDQNYPNPFNPTTIVSAQWPVVSQVHLAVYDILGREVAVLVDGKKEAGKYEVTFDASRLASGVYICRLMAGDPSTGSGRGFVAARKMLVIR